ncbi:MAG: hypothetical protein PHE63_00255 [Eubacteriales bacterium]|nr:hypothetical protein [Eubacteriales bacterium]
MEILSRLLSFIRNDTGVSALFSRPMIDVINAFDTAEIPAIVYTYSPITDDGIKRLDRLEIRIISEDYSHALAVDEAITACLLTAGDNSKDNKILNINKNGGGSLKDDNTQTYHLFSFYIVQSR